MSKYEIDVSGLPEGWEPISVRYPNLGEYYLSMSGVVCLHDSRAENPDSRLIVRRKVRKFDWTQVLPDVLVTVGGKALYRSVDVDTPYPKDMKLSEEWQPNIVGRCPVDPEASVVRALLVDGTETEKRAAKLVWDTGLPRSSIVAWRFVRLADGYEW